MTTIGGTIVTRREDDDKAKEMTCPDNDSVTFVCFSRALTHTGHGATGAEFLAEAMLKRNFPVGPSAHFPRHTTAQKLTG